MYHLVLQNKWAVSIQALGAIHCIVALLILTRIESFVLGHALHHFTAIGKWEEAKKSKRDPSIYENINNMDESSSNGQSDDGNFDYCIGTW